MPNSHLMKTPWDRLRPRAGVAGANTDGRIKIRLSSRKVVRLERVVRIDIKFPSSLTSCIYISITSPIWQRNLDPFSVAPYSLKFVSGSYLRKIQFGVQIRTARYELRTVPLYRVLQRGETLAGDSFRIDIDEDTLSAP